MVENPQLTLDTKSKKSFLLQIFREVPQVCKFWKDPLKISRELFPKKRNFACLLSNEIVTRLGIFRYTRIRPHCVEAWEWVKRSHGMISWHYQAFAMWRPADKVEKPKLSCFCLTNFSVTLFITYKKTYQNQEKSKQDYGSKKITNIFLDGCVGHFLSTRWPSTTSGK